MNSSGEILADRRWGALAVIGPVLAMACIAISIALSPWFSFTDNALSDLGVGSAASIFNFGLAACGIMVLLFIPELRRHLASGHAARAGIALLALSVISLLGIGLFPEDRPPWHFRFSAAFFILLLLSGLVLYRPLAAAGRRYLALAGMTMSVVGVAAWLLIPFRGVAVPELASAVPGAVWIMMLGWQVLRDGALDECNGGRAE